MLTRTSPLLAPPALVLAVLLPAAIVPARAPDTRTADRIARVRRGLLSRIQLQGPVSPGQWFHPQS